jgi:hypothetical protein
MNTCGGCVTITYERFPAKCRFTAEAQRTQRKHRVPNQTYAGRTVDRSASEVRLAVAHLWNEAC